VKCCLAILFFAAVCGSSTMAAQESCPRAELPAYAHNDYENDKPLIDALRLGYQGVEADVFLIDGVLRVGHDRRHAAKRLSLEHMYLEPLQRLATRCGGIVTEGAEFMLIVELKEASRPAFDSLLALIGRYRDMLWYADRDSLRGRAVMVRLVGWHPPPSQLGTSQMANARLHYKLTRPQRPKFNEQLSWLFWMLSADYGKSIAGWLPTNARRDRWLRVFHELADSGRTIRVYNVPRDSAVYRQLLAAGVTLIGTKTLAATRELLLPLVRLARCYTIEAGPWVIPPDAVDRHIPELPHLVMRDSLPPEGFFEGSAWRRLTTYSRNGARLGPGWMWHSSIGSFSITDSNGFGGVSLDFRIAGDSIYGRAEVFSDMVGSKYPYAPARGHAVTCPG
jgi:hypothetical protein